MNVIASSFMHVYTISLDNHRAILQHAHYTKTKAQDVTSDRYKRPKHINTNMNEFIKFILVIAVFAGNLTANKG